MSNQPNRREMLTGAAILGSIRDRIAGIGPREYLSFSRRAMASEFSVFMPADEAGLEAGRRAAAAVRALDLVEELESQLSVYRDDSEISQLNQDAFQQPVVIEAQFFALLQESIALWKATDRAFDVTSGPLARLWGFHDRKPRLPTEDEIRAALEFVGSQKLTLDSDDQTVRFDEPNVEINLGAIGKGHALDRCGQALRSVGHERFLIHGGMSSVLAASDQASATWKIDLRLPSADRTKIATFHLTNAAIATSGDAFQQFNQDGRVFGHIIDPRTGWPSQGVLMSTVIADTAAKADALSTAFYILGVEGSRAYCQAHPEVSAILVVETERGQPEPMQIGVPSIRVDWQ